MTGSRIARPGASIRDAVRRLGWDLPLFGVAAIADQGGRLVLSLAAAAVLGPAVFGTWVIAALLIQYGNLTSLGLGQGAGREIPRLLGAGDPAVDRVEDVAVAGTIATALVAGLATVAFGSAILGPHGSAVTVGLLAVAVVLQQVFLLEQVLFRSRLRFRAAAVQLAAQGVAAPGVGIALLVGGAGIDGLLVARIAVFAVAALLAPRTLARIPRPAWDPAIARRLVGIGAPMLLAGFLLLALVTIDRWVVLTLLGREATGLYGLVGLAVSSLVLLPALISQQFYPRLAYARGEDASGARLGRIADEQSALAGALAGAGALAVAVAALVGIPALLPAYEPTIRPILVALAGVVVYAWASASANVLNLLDRQRSLIAIQLGAIAIDVTFAVVAIRAGLGIDGVALAFTTALVAYSVVVRMGARSALRAGTA